MELYDKCDMNGHLVKVNLELINLEIKSSFLKTKIIKISKSKFPLCIDKIKRIEFPSSKISTHTYKYIDKCEPFMKYKILSCFNFWIYPTDLFLSCTFLNVVNKNFDFIIIHRLDFVGK